MSRVFVSEGIGAGIYVFSDDHCPPHVHAQHRGDGWIARVGFSYVTSVVELISIAPVRNIPLQRVVNQLLDDVEAHLAICRRQLVGDTKNSVLGKSMGHDSEIGKDGDFGCECGRGKTNHGRRI
jgi:hypothetical protein